MRSRLGSQPFEIRRRQRHIRKARPFHWPERAVGKARTEIFVAVAQKAFDNLSRMLTDQRARQVVRSRGFGKFERSILHLAPPERRMLHFEIHLAMEQLRVM